MPNSSAGNGELSRLKVDVDQDGAAALSSMKAAVEIRFNWELAGGPICELSRVKPLGLTRESTAFKQQWLPR
ncbi:hypothetical protein [Cupriavidus sp. CP313]